MLYFSSLLKADSKYTPAADRFSAVLDASNIKYQYIDNTKDIWLRDFMPILTGSGRYIYFRYEPLYLRKNPELQTVFKKDIAPQLDLPVTYSDINLDGGNVVFSPSKERVIISDRVFFENPDRDREKLIGDLSKLLEAEIIIIPSLKSDMTGHADGMVRFVDEHTVIGNDIPSKNGLEQRIKQVVSRFGMDVIDFPYQSAVGYSAVGTYLNYLETDTFILLPVFGLDMDEKAITEAQRIFSKKIVPINIREIAEEGGCLNCISWENDI